MAANRRLAELRVFATFAFRNDLRRRDAFVSEYTRGRNLRYRGGGEETTEVEPAVPVPAPR